MIGKETWKEYKKDFGAKSTLTAMYVFLLACSLLMNIWFSATMILTLPFIVLPFTFAYFATICGMPISKQAPIKSFFLFYPVYFTQFFFGGFRAILGFFKSLLISVVFTALLTIILYYTYLRGQPGFAEILQEIEAAKNIAEMNTAMDHFYAFSPANLTLNIASMVGTFFGAWVFIRHCLLNSEKFCLNLLTNKPLPMKAVNRLYLTAAHLRRKQFYKEYYGAVWYIVLWFVLTFGGAAYVSAFIFNLTANQALFIGLFVSLVLNFPFIPYYFEVIKNVFIASSDDYSKASIQLSERALFDLKKNNQISEDEQKKLEEELSKSKEEYERMLKEAEEGEKAEEVSKKDEN